MARRNSYQSILGDSWHDGSGSVRYSFLDADMPRYNRAVDTDGDGIKDAWRVGGGMLGAVEAPPIGEVLCHHLPHKLS